MTYTQHPLSAAFPSMSADDFQSLKDSIEVNGVLNPITLFEGQVIDGWHRYTAANEVGQNCPTQELESWIDPKDYVLAQNKNRRHITVAQLATATAAVYEWHPAHRPNKSVVPTDLKTSKELAEIAGVSTASIEKAKTVQTKAVPEVQQAVKDGKIGLEKAVAISKLPKEDQAAAIAKPMQKKSVADFTAIHAQRREAERAESAEVMLEMANAEIESMREALALADLPEHERVEAKDLIDKLKAENKALKAQIKVIESQRDQYMTTCSEMEVQIKRLNRRA